MKGRAAKERAVVTGAPGFLGNNLVRTLLEEGRDVTCLIHPSFKGSSFEKIFPRYKEINATFMDIRAPQAELMAILKGAESVFNCAGVQHPKRTRNIYSGNRDGPVNLLKACIGANVQNFIHISSSTVHGSNKGGIPMTEESPFSPLTHYAKSKVEGERLLQKNAHQGTKMVIIRPTVFYGYPASRNFSELMSRLQAGKVVPIIGKKGPLRSYVNITKVAEGILLAEKGGKTGDVFIISDEEPLNTCQFYQSMCRGLGVEPKTISFPLFGSRAAEKLSLIGGHMNIHLKYFNVLGEMGRDSYMVPDKAMKQLGFRPVCSSSRGLEEMAAKFKESAPQ